MVLADAGEMIQVRSIVGELDLMGRSGSPFFSQSTGRIIGLLSVSEGEGNNQTIILAPARYGTGPRVCQSMQFIASKD